MKAKIFRVGIIPYYIDNGEIEFLFMKPSDARFGGSEFQIAKGKLEDNENEFDGALREGHEELGLLRKNCKNFLDIGYHLGRTRLWITNVKNKTDFDIPHFETDETRWISEYNLSSIRNIHKPIILDVVKIIKSKKDILDQESK